MTDLRWATIASGAEMITAFDAVSATIPPPPDTAAGAWVGGGGGAPGAVAETTAPPLTSPARIARSVCATRVASAFFR